MKNNVIINVIGNRNTGVTTIQQIIYEALQQKGFDIELNFQEYSDFKNEKEFNENLNKLNNERANSVIAKSKITLENV